MSKNIFINNLDTYVSQAIFKELRNDQPGEDGEPNPDAYKIFGTYISKDSSLPPEGIKKMLKVRCNLNIYFFPALAQAVTNEGPMAANFEFFLLFCMNFFNFVWCVLNYCFDDV